MLNHRWTLKCVYVCVARHSVVPDCLWLPPGSSVHGIFQARILELVEISSSRGSSPTRNQTCVSYIGRQFLYYCDTWEAQTLKTLY